jgi:hypothetical protein
VVSGHRDGAVYDRAVADTLTGLGLTPTLTRGYPGPARFAAVGAGAAVALTTAAVAAGSGLIVRELAPTRHVRFALLWRDKTPAPALRALILTAEAGAAPKRPQVAAA